MALNRRPQMFATKCKVLIISRLCDLALLIISSDRRIRLEVEERSPEYALFDEYMRAKWMTILASSYPVVTPSLPKKFVCLLPSRFLKSVLWQA